MRPTLPVWPDHLRDLARHQRDLLEPSARQENLGRLWLVVAAAVDQSIRRTARGLRCPDHPELEDLAAQKALELVTRIDRGEWRPEDDEPARVGGYVRATARNAIADLLRREGRRVTELDEDWEASLPDPVESTPSVEEQVDAGRFVAQLARCVESLQPRARTIWFLRVFYDLPSRTIGRHPEVAMSVGHVDVTLHRARTAVGQCMREHGFDTTEIPRGSFDRMWREMRAPAEPEATATEERT